MTKRDLTKKISKKTGIPYADVKEIVQQTFDNIVEGIASGDHIEFRGFGIFEMQLRKARIGRNPNIPNSRVKIPEHRVIKFKAGKTLREKVLNSTARIK